MTHLRRLSALLPLALLLLLSAPPLLAQGGDAEPADAAPAPPPPETVEVPPGLSSPRATMRTFLEAFDPEKRDPEVEPLEQAARCLDLSELREDLRTRQGKELAASLKEVIDRTAYIEFDRIPDDPDAEPWRLPVEGTAKIVIGPDGNGIWRFTAATVAAIPEMLVATQEREVVEGAVRGGTTTPAMWLRSQMPQSLRKVVFLLENWQWLGLLILAFAGVVLDKTVAFLARGVVARFLARRTEAVDPGELRHAVRPVGLLAAALLWWAGLFWLGLPTHVLEVLVVAVKLVAAVAFVWAAYRIVDVFAALLEARAARSENKFDDLLVPLFRKSFKVFIAAFGLVFIADTAGLPVRSLLAGLGIGGLALALAAQDAVKNFFGSLLVIIDRPFSVGDWVKIGDVEGTVIELGFRSTRIKTFYDSTITLPNATLLTASVDNLGLRTYRRWSTHLSLPYDTPAEKIEAFCEGVRELVRRHPYTRKDAYHVYLNKFSAASADVLLYIFFDTPDWSTELRERHRLAVDVMRLAADLGVEFAFPTQTLYLKRPGDGPGLEAPDGYGDRLGGVHEEARERARRLVDGALDGRVPPPVGAEDRGSED